MLLQVFYGGVVEGDVLRLVKQRMVHCKTHSRLGLKTLQLAHPHIHQNQAETAIQDKLQKNPNLL